MDTRDDPEIIPPDQQVRYDIKRVVEDYQARQTFDDRVGFVLIAVSMLCWPHAALFHLKTGDHVLLALDVVFPPFGIVFGAGRILGLL